MVSRTRQLYKAITQGNRPDERKIRDTIQASRDFQNLQKTAGWKRLDEWIEKNRTGTHEFMEHEVSGRVSVWTMVGLFNTFVRYLFLLQENRAYSKIRTFMQITIEKGEQYAKEQQRRDEQQKQKDQSR